LLTLYDRFGTARNRRDILLHDGPFRRWMIGDFAPPPDPLTFSR